ncbi:MAG: hypothetical protein V2I33_17265, partial [Kangiellaceae bacterium]|nr:hypothetical protein [Kangiellaceae bacterium]
MRRLLSPSNSPPIGKPRESQIINQFLELLLAMIASVAGVCRRRMRRRRRRRRMRMRMRTRRFQL